jgi:hypothetical protein
MKKLFALVALILVVIGHSYGQITKDVAKPLWNLDQTSMSSLETISLEKPSIDALRIEDSINANSKGIPWRFGVAIDQQIDLMEEASRTLQGGMLKLSLTISADDAKSLNFNFEDFELSENALLYFSSLDQKDYLGAISHQNNKTDRQFSTRPIKGSRVQLELFVPQSEVDDNSAVISQVVYGYRDVFSKSSKTFNSSGSCNRNTNCPEALIWQDIKRSVMLITASNNTRLCTGTLINNVRQDSTPYVLTASHCNLATNSIFVFNYENSSPNCNTSADGSLAYSISGAFDRAESSYSDFKLFELSQTPPSSYQVYYSGWNADEQAAYEATSIHHPSGDIKKISQDYDTLRSTFYLPPTQNTHWQVGNWETGTTESGSSGAPLFDQNKRIVGQLEGGGANCNNNLNDYYGKFSLSWDYNLASNRQLKIWLDPDSTNTLQLDGMDPIAKANNWDIELTYVSGVPSFSCDTIIDPVVHFLNRGNDTLRSVSIEYGLNQQYNQLFNWSGELASDQLTEVSLPSLVLDSLDSNLVVRLRISPTDQDSSNNSWSKAISANVDPLIVSLRFKSDQYGYETSWEIVEQQNQKLIAKGGPYVEAPNSNGLIYNEQHCLYNGCFELRLFDAFGDGFTSQFFGNGYFLLRDQNGDTLVYEDNFTTAQKNFNFCVTNNVSVNNIQYQDLDFTVYPNPAKAGERLLIRAEFNSPPRIQLYDLQGRLLQEDRSNSLLLNKDLTDGLYIIQLTDDNQIIGRAKLLVH